jgi:membrane associated rhomboid family serine protease
MRTPSLTPIIKAIIVINIIVFGVQSINEGYKAQIWEFCSLYYFTSEKFHFFQLVTSMFVHQDIGHLFSNMLGLFFLGPILEMFWGEKRFLIFYFFTGIGAGILYMGLKYYDYHHLESLANNFLQNPQVGSYITWYKEVFNGSTINGIEQLTNAELQANLEETKASVSNVMSHVLNDSSLKGASGAVFGIMAGFGLLFPNTELMLLFFPFPIKAKYFVTFYALYEIYAGLNKMPGDNVAHFAHIGGMIFAFILIKIWGKKRDSFY